MRMGGLHRRREEVTMERGGEDGEMEDESEDGEL
jgi:hypothetical protein